MSLFHMIIDTFLPTKTEDVLVALFKFAFFAIPAAIVAGIIF